MKTKSNPFLRLIPSGILHFAYCNFLSLALWQFGTHSAQAASGTWTQTTSGGLWSATGNWSGGTVADGSGFTADFSTINIAADNTVKMDASHTLTKLIFGDTTTSSAASWTLDNNGSSSNILTLAGTTPTITVNALGTNKTVTISAGIAGSDLTKDGVGTLILSGSNTYTGSTTVSGGRLVLTNSNQTSAVSIASGAFLELTSTASFGSAFTLTGNGTLTLNGSTTFGSAAGTISLGAGALIDLQTSGSFNGGASSNKNYANNFASLNVASGSGFGTSNIAVRMDALTGSGTIDASSSQTGGSFTFGVGNGSGTFGGSLTTSGTNKFVFTKLGSGTQTFTGNSTFTTAMPVSNGTIILSGANGAFSNTSGLTVGTATNAATLTLDNTTNNNTARIADAATLTLNNGTFNYQGNASAASTETLAGITASTGHSVINMSGGASGQIAVLTSSASTITRTAPATLNILADGTNQQFKLTGGSAGMLNKGVYLNGNDFAFYPGAGAALRAPNYGSDTDFATATSTALTASKHNKLSGSIASQGAVSIYSLNMPGNFSLTALTGNLTFTDSALQGGIIKSGGGAAQIGGATDAFDIVGQTGGELVFNTVAAGDNLTLNVGITATTTGLTKTGAGTLTLTGNRDYLYTGNTTVNSGTLVLNSASANGFKSTSITINNGGTVQLGNTGKVVDTAVFTINSGGTFDMNGRADTIGALTGSGSVTNSGSARILTLSSGTQNFSGVIGGGANVALAITGATQTLSGANTYSGGTTISTGTVIGNNASSFGSGPITITGSTAVTAQRLQLSTNDFTIANDITISATTGQSGTGLIQTTSGNSILTGNISITATPVGGGIFAASGGSLTVNGTITASVPVTVRAGTVTFNNGGTGYSAFMNQGATVKIGSDNGLATTASLDVGASGTAVFDLNGFSQSLTGITTTSPTNAARSTIQNGSATNASTLTINNSANSQYDGLIAAGGAGGLSLVKQGSGALTLGGANTYTGATTISEGTLSAGSIVVSSGNSNLGNATAAVTLGAALTQGTLSYTGNSASYTRGFTIGGAGGGRLNVTTSGQTLQVNTGDVTGSGLFTVGGAGNTTINANLTHTGGLTKADAGTLTLSGTGNTYSGNTTIKAGTLALGASGTFANSTVITVGDAGSSSTVLDLTAKSSFSFGSGQTVKGIGTINIGSGKTVTVGGILAPGNSIGTINETGNLTLTGTLQSELGTPNASAASGVSDRTVVSGGLTLTGSTLQLIDNAGANSQGSAGAGAYRLMTYGGTLTGTFGTVTNPLSATLHEKVIYGPASGGGSVDLNLYRLATANTITTPVALGNARVGGTLSQNLNIQNTATNDGFSEGLNASGGSLTGSATTSGSITNLAAGSTNNSSLLVGLSTATAGAKTGTVAIGLDSNGSGTSGYGTTPLTGQTITVNGSVFNPAVAATIADVSVGKTRVGGTLSGTAALTISNTAPSGAFTEGLNATVGSGSGASGSGSISNLSGGSSDTSSISLGLVGANCTTSGLKTGTVTINLASSGTNSGLSDLGLTSQTVGVSGLVYDYADAVFSKTSIDSFSFSGSGSSYSLNFGTGLDLNTTYTATIQLANHLLSGYQDNLGGSYGSLPTSQFASGVEGTSIASLVAGTANTFTITFNTGSTGNFSDTLTFTGASQQSGLSDATLGAFTINLTANAVPEPDVPTLIGGIGMLCLLRRRR